MYHCANKIFKYFIQHTWHTRNIFQDNRVEILSRAAVHWKNDKIRILSAGNHSDGGRNLKITSNKSFADVDTETNVHRKERILQGEKFSSSLLNLFNFYRPIPPPPLETFVPR